MLIRSLLKIFFFLFCLAFIGILIAPFALYQYGILHLGNDINPSPIVYTERVNEKYLQWLGSTESTKFREFNPYSASFAILSDLKARSDKRNYRAVDLHLISLANRALSLRAEASANTQLEWISANFAGIVYISSNWTKTEMISTALGETYYGRVIYDLDSAAQLYYGTSADELNDTQLFSLFLLPFAPNTYDLWCGGDRNIQKNTEWVLARNIQLGEGDQHLLPAPAKACKQ